MKRYLLYLSLILAAATGLGCATIITGSKNQIEVYSEPPGATVKVEDIVTNTPAILKLRGNSDYIVTIEKTGFEPVYKKLTASFNGLVLFDILIPPGFIVDLATGAGWSLQPKKIDVKLSAK